MKNENYYINWNNKGDVIGASTKDSKLIFFDIKTMSIMYQLELKTEKNEKYDINEFGWD